MMNLKFNSVSDAQSTKLKLEKICRANNFCLIFLILLQVIKFKSYNILEIWNILLFLRLLKQEIKEFTQKKNRSQLMRTCVIYEYPKGGELYEYLFQTGNINETQARLYFKQIVEGLIQVHKLGLFHGELTTENIFFSDAKTIKIGELGLNLIRKKKYIYEGTKWAELNNNYQQSKDIFALGMILFSIIFGKPPFSSVEKNTNFSALQIQPQIFWEKLQSNFPRVIITDIFKDLIQGMLAETPFNRLSLSEVYNHPWTQMKSEFTEEMIREFYSKQKKIEQFLVKVRLSRELYQNQMIISNNKQQHEKGIGNFYRSDENDKSSIQDKQILEKYIKQISINLLKSDDYLFSSINPEKIMNYIRKSLEAKDFNLEIMEKCKQNYQFSMMIQSELGVEIKVQLLQLETEKDILCFHFTKLKGEILNFIETVRRFHQIIDKNLQKLSQDNEQVI